MKFTLSTPAVRGSAQRFPGRRQRWTRNGVAVGASAAVPGLFEPIAFKNLYPMELAPPKVVRLCDGGVHDNQGVAALLDQSCKVLFVSDASGQMGAEDDPKNGAVGVLLRADSILQARLREAQYRDFAARRRSGLLQGSMFIHLTKELAADPVNWVGCSHPKREVPPPPLTTYGVDRRIQQQLAEVRTDLDSFSNAEAYALMTSGYLMAKQCATRENFPTLPPLVPTTHTWGFLGVRDAMDGSNREAQEKLTGLLTQSKKLAFKVWSQVPALTYASRVLLIAIGAAIVWLLWDKRGETLYTLSWNKVAATLLMIVLSTIGLQWVKFLDVNRLLRRIAVGLGVSTAGWLAARIHLHFFDPLFLKVGWWARAEAQASVASGVATDGATLPIADSEGTADTVVPAQPAADEKRADEGRG